ncbi:hypothetical protein N9A22_01815 [Methylophilaceae bacterium]|nr:hypothetical protein [Methylophilaceae bacterium]
MYLVSVFCLRILEVKNRARATKNIPWVGYVPVMKVACDKKGIPANIDIDAKKDKGRLTLNDTIHKKKIIDNMDMYPIIIILPTKIDLAATTWQIKPRSIGCRKKFTQSPKKALFTT